MNRSQTNKTGLNRRRFFGKALAGSLGLAGASAQLRGLGGPAAQPAAPSGETTSTSSTPALEPSTSTGQFVEPARKLPLRDDADVIVCGGGPAGFAAALTAARAGAETRLFERHGCLGGVWTAGLLTYIFDFEKPGLTCELARRLDKRSARTVTTNLPSQFVYVPEEMKLLLEEMCVKAGVQFQLHTQVAHAYRQSNRLATVVTESKSGRQAWQARVFIDATGDGDLGALAGCRWDIGQEKDCPCQPMTLNALIGVRNAAALKDYISFYEGRPRHMQAVQQFLGEIRRAGLEPSYGHPTLFHVRGNLLLLMINHEYGIKPFDAAQITEATVRARAEVHRIANGLKLLAGPWDGLQVVASAEHIGVRDGRRIHGRYQVSREDLVAGARHSDAVARVNFHVDIHAATRGKNDQKPISDADVKMKPYDIPLRALLARHVDGLMMAGRCISGDFIAHASYRVTGNAVAMGEAAGAVAALAAQSKRHPHEVAWSEAERLLEKIGHRLPQ